MKACITGCAHSKFGKADQDDLKALNMMSVYPRPFPIIGDIGKNIRRRVSVLTGGELEINLHEPGKLIPMPEARNAASYSLGFAQGIMPSGVMFTSVTFAPGVPGYLAGQHNIKSVLCSTIPSEASGWFSVPIETVDDLNGIKMRIFGLGARVMERLRVAGKLLPPGDLEQQIGAFVEYYNNERYHESLSNVTPANVHFGRDKSIGLEC